LSPASQKAYQGSDSSELEVMDRDDLSTDLEDAGLDEDADRRQYSRGQEPLDDETEQPLPPQSTPPPFEPDYQRRSKCFHLTRILLKSVAEMSRIGELSLQKKGVLKDLIVDQDHTILTVAEMFDKDRDEEEFKDSLMRLASRQFPAHGE